MEAIESKPLTLAVGPAGTGKTYLAISAAVEALEAGSVSRIVLSRPAVEAGENLGFLPGDMREKLDPYLRPLWDALNDRLGAKRLRQNLDDGTIEIAPVAFMRGRTLNNSFVLIDEAQNCTYGQLKMLLTRLGWHSTMVMTGDPDQTDLLPELSGLGSISPSAWTASTTWPWCVSPTRTWSVIRWSDGCCRCSEATELIHTSKRDQTIGSKREHRGLHAIFCSPFAAEINKREQCTRSRLAVRCHPAYIKSIR